MRPPTFVHSTTPPYRALASISSQYHPGVHTEVPRQPTVVQEEWLSSASVVAAVSYQRALRVEEVTSLRLGAEHRRVGLRFQTQIGSPGRLAGPKLVEVASRLILVSNRLPRPVSRRRMGATGWVAHVLNPNRLSKPVSRYPRSIA